MPIPPSAGYGENRKSYGGLAQVTYKLPETNLKLGFNYGTSRLSRADNEVDPTLVHAERQVHSRRQRQLPELMLLAEGTSMWSRNQVGDENKAWVANVGAFRKFCSDRATSSALTRNAVGAPLLSHPRRCAAAPHRSACWSVDPMASRRVAPP